MSDELIHESPAETTEESSNDTPSTTTRTSDKDYNLRVIAARAEAAERRAEELERIIRQNMSSGRPSQQIALEEEDDDDDISISDDTYVDGSSHKKSIRKLRKDLRETKKQFAETIKESTTMMAEVRLKSQFSDFESVVSAKNLERLAVDNPTLHRAIFAQTSLYERGATAYEILKNHAPHRKHTEQHERVDANMSKPRAAASMHGQVSDSPLAQVSNYDRVTLSDAAKKEIMRQVARAKLN